MTRGNPPLHTRSRVAIWLGRPAVVWQLALLGVVSLAPSLGIGLVLDDVLHRDFIEQHAEARPGLRPWWEMFTFFDEAGSGDAIAAAPWWADPALTIRLCRPLSVATHYLDYALWPNSPALMHAHSLAWYALLLLLTGVFFRRILGANWIAGLALLLYAVDAGHAHAAGWVGGRNTLIATTLAMGSIVAYERARSLASARALALSCVLLLLALTAGEAGIGAWAFLLACAACIDRAPVRARVVALLPAGAVTLAWLAVARGFDCGVRGSGIYLDPRSAPLAFLSALPQRLLVALSEQLGLPAALLAALPGAWLAWGIVAAGVLACSFTLALVALARTAPRPLLFWGGAMLASAVAVCATWPFPRLLLLTGVGGAACVALVIAHALGRWRERPRALGALAWGALGVMLLVVHGPVALALRLQAPGALLDLDRAYHALAESLVRPDTTGKTVFVLNAPDYFRADVAREYARRDPAAPAAIHVVATSARPVTLTRLTPTTLVLDAGGGAFFDATSYLVRPTDAPFARGDGARLGPARVTVDDIAPDARPTRLRLELDDMGDPRHAFGAIVGMRFESIALPEPGGSVMIPVDAEPRPRR